MSTSLSFPASISTDITGFSGPPLLWCNGCSCGACVLWGNFECLVCAQLFFTFIPRCIRVRRNIIILIKLILELWSHGCLNQVLLHGCRLAGCYVAIFLTFILFTSMEGNLLANYLPSEGVPKIELVLETLVCFNLTSTLVSSIEFISIIFSEKDPALFLLLFMVFASKWYI